MFLCRKQSHLVLTSGKDLVFAISKSMIVGRRYHVKVTISHTCFVAVIMLFTLALCAEADITYLPRMKSYTDAESRFTLPARVANDTIIMCRIACIG